MTDRGSDREAQRARFDPRFDPAFQPGYDPKNDPAIAARSGSRFAAPPSAFVDPRYEVAPSVTAATSAPASPAVSPPPATTVQREQTAQDQAADEAPARGVNPFVVVLWVVSAVFFAGGVMGLRALPGLEQAASSSPGASYFVLQVYAYGYPLLIALGLATATGLLFFHASRWTKRTRGDASA